jgi:hypothetical protein
MYGGVTIGQLCVLCSVHGCGLLSAALARMLEGGRWQEVSQRIFVGLLVVVAFTTALSLGNASQHWFLSAGTLAIMVVTAVCDFANPL